MLLEPRFGHYGKILLQSQLLTDPTPRPIVPAILPRPPNAPDASGSCASGGGPGGDPKPPKKDDDEEEKKKCERHEKAQKDLDRKQIQLNHERELNNFNHKDCDGICEVPTPPDDSAAGIEGPDSTKGSWSRSDKLTVAGIGATIGVGIKEEIKSGLASVVNQIAQALGINSKNNDNNKDEGSE